MPQTAAEPRILISVATYNERDNLAPLLWEIRQMVPTADVLVIDDHSPDGTGQLADELATADPHIRVLHRPGKLGLGTAILAAMRQAMDQDYDLLVNMDADFSHHPRYLPALLAGMNRHDVMIGFALCPRRRFGTLAAVAPADQSFSQHPGPDPDADSGSRHQRGLSLLQGLQTP